MIWSTRLGSWATTVAIQARLANRTFKIIKEVVDRYIEEGNLQKTY